ncbi:APC family permease [Shimia thalassica]|uniref:APC family permease n=1 Tax=Shimia thalassica TaxID=1715693 RepID=UPI0026E3AC62|nr:APC family permease [Shimia thalassica]MDO6483281.1 APC family permease [Shimia thalassica]MDO6798458.1 APC family permease [Shimia thalassica]
MRPDRPSTAPPLGLAELIAIALGGMVGGGIFTVLGLSVATIGAWTPVAIGLGGCIAALAAYSYVKLALFYRDEGATYAFFKRSFPHHDFSAALIGWWVVFGYISTIALYAFTFASYAIAPFSDDPWLRKIVAWSIILAFAGVNIWSTKGMGRLEDLLVYTKIVILLVVAGVLWGNASIGLPELFPVDTPIPLLGIVTIASVTFVAYEGFQLVIHAMDDMARPEHNIPRAIYAAVTLATGVYVVIAVGAVLAIPFDEIIANQEHALASGAGDILGPIGTQLVIAGALLATMSAISGTLFGASRLMSVIARDGFFPKWMAPRPRGIPRNAVLSMAGFACLLILIGDLRLILEFGSITFLLVSLLMAWANHVHRAKTEAHPVMTIAAIGGLSAGAILILWFEAAHAPAQLAFVLVLYGLLSLGAWVFTKLG